MTARAFQYAACIVVHDNGDGFVELCDSLASQTIKPKTTVVCLTGQKPETHTRVRETLPSAIIVERPDNPGFSGGVNACLSETSEPFVLLLNPDVELGADYTQLGLEAMARDPRIGAVGGLLIREDAQGQPIIDSAGFDLQPWYRVVDRASGSSELDRFQDEEEVLGACGAALLLSRPALDKVCEDGQVMDEDFWMYKEDQDLCLKLSLAGYRTMLVPAAKARHGRGWAPEGRFSVPVELRRHSLKNRYLLMWKHWRWTKDFWRIPFILGFEVILALGLLVRDPKVLPGYIKALGLMSRMLKKRKQLLLRFSERRRES